MIVNKKESARKDDIKSLCIVIACFLFVVWLCTPPGNKFAQLCFWGNNTQYLVAKLTKSKEDIEAWKFLRNNAVYLMLMDRPQDAIKEMDKSIKHFPSYMSEGELNNLYLDRAKMHFYIGDYTGALNDYSRLGNLSIIDNFRVALMYKEVGKNKLAMQHCNTILNMQPNAYFGYVCVADIYASAGRYDTSVKVFDLLINNVPNRARYYADRAFYKKKAGDIEGYVQDIEKAKSILPNIEEEQTIIYETLHPKKMEFRTLK